MEQIIFVAICLFFYFLLYELTSSVGMLIYFIKAKAKYPALVFVPFYKYYYFSKYSKGFCPFSVGYKLPNIILPIFYTLTLAMLFVGLEPFIVCLMFFLFYSAFIYRGIFYFADCKDILMATVLSTFGFSGPVLLFVALRKKDKPKKQKKQKRLKKQLKEAE